MLTHERGVQLSPSLAKVYRNQQPHDPSNLSGAREIATIQDQIPVGILYRNPTVPCYEDLRRGGQLRSTSFIKKGLEAELDKFTIWPRGTESPAMSA